MTGNEPYVLFSSARPLGRCENITALYEAYDGAKHFVTHADFKASRGLRGDCYSLMVDDDFGKGSRSPVIMVSHGIPTKTYGLTQRQGLLKWYGRKDAEKIIWATSSSEDGKLNALLAKEYGIPINRILPLGMPRFDRYIGKKAGDGLTGLRDAGKRVYLYAPTFRTFDRREAPPMDFKTLDRLLWDNELFVVKTHMCNDHYCLPRYRHIIQIPASLPSAPYIIDCDVMVTDYSSIMWDAHFLRKPVVLWSPDEEKYRNVRGFAFRYPDEYSSNGVTGRNGIDAIRELLFCIRTAGHTVWDEKLRERMCGACDGHSTKKTIELIKRCI